MKVFKKFLADTVTERAGSVTGIQARVVYIDLDRVVSLETHRDEDYCIEIQNLLPDGLNAIDKCIMVCETENYVVHAKQSDIVDLLKETFGQKE